MTALLVPGTRLRAEGIVFLADGLRVEAEQVSLAQEASGEALRDADPSACCDRFAACREGARWTVDANALFLTRRVAPASLIADYTTGAGLLNASSLDLSTHAGVEFGLIRHWDCGNAVEVRYAGVDGWDAQTVVPTNPNDVLQINLGIPLTVAAGSAIDADYASQWHSFEINGRHEFCQQRLAVLAGFRYVEVDENWGFTLVDTAPLYELEASTRNRLYGFQLGGQAVLWDRGGRLSVDAVGKAGIYGNRAAQDTLFVTAAASATDAQTAAAFLGELELVGKYRITERLSLLGGYRLMWIDGLALAPEHLAANDGFGGGIDTSGGAFFHGALVGLEYVR
jgi:hypothetical protein